MGWGEKAIEIRSVETGHLDGVFMHKRAQRLKFLCERNDKVRLLPSQGEAPPPHKVRLLPPSVMCNRGDERTRTCKRERR